MVRIRGTVGQWPVDLSIELEEHEWAQLGAQPGAQRGVSVQPEVPSVASASASASASTPDRPAVPDDRPWQAARHLLQQAGSLNGPDLLSQLETLAGSASAAKRLLVRLRHSPDVRVDSGADAPLYSWVDAETAN